MCLIAFAWRAHPRYPLIITANRDEFHARPTAPLQRWAENPDVIGGRDLREGGSWMALRRGGRLAAVTNVRNPDLKTGQRSRGELVSRFVLDEASAARAAEALRQHGPHYGGFNLLLHDGETLRWVSNYPEHRTQDIEPGVHAISNGAPSFIPDEHPWPKMQRSMAALGEWLTTIPEQAEPDTTALFAMLADAHPAPDAQLPDTGVGIEIERLLSPPFIRGMDYGTRCSSVALIETNGNITMIERRFGPDGARCGDSRCTVP